MLVAPVICSTWPGSTLNTDRGADHRDDDRARAPPRGVAPVAAAHACARRADQEHCRKPVDDLLARGRERHALDLAPSAIVWAYASGRDERRERTADEVPRATPTNERRAPPTRVHPTSTTNAAPTGSAGDTSTVPMAHDGQPSHADADVERDRDERDDQDRRRHRSTTPSRLQRHDQRVASPRRSARSVGGNDRALHRHCRSAPARPPIRARRAVCPPRIVQTPPPGKDSGKIRLRAQAARWPENQSSARRQPSFADASW